MSDRCAAGCGFFSNVAFEGYCSKCYKEMKAKNAPVVTSPTAAVIADVTTDAIAATQTTVGNAAVDSNSNTSNNVTEATTTATTDANAPTSTETIAAVANAPETIDEKATTAPAVADAVEEENALPPQVPGRCFACNKKIGLNGFDCRCNRTLCSLHRMPEAHNCSFDYQAFGREKIQKKNEQCVANKLDKL